MNWSKVKTALIILFLCIDVFLIAWNTSLDTRSNRVDDKTIARSVGILEKNGVLIDRALIPFRSPEIKSLTLINSIGNQAVFLEKVLGDGYEKDANKFFSSDKSVTIDKNTFTIVFPGTINSASDARDYLERFGFDLSGATAVVSPDGYRFILTCDDYQVFGSEIFVSEENSRVTASGVWVTPKSEQKRENLSIRHVTSVFPKFIADPNRPEECEIVKIDFGYGIPTITGSTADEFIEGVSVPVWRLELASGESFYYSAVIEENA